MIDRDKPFLYRLFRTILIISSGIIIVLIIAFIMKFLLESPLYRMFDGIAILSIVNMAITIPIIICYIVAWLHAIGGGIASLFPIIGYTVVESIQNGMYTATAVNYIMIAISLLFIVQGIIKKRLEIDRLDILFAPKIDDHQGPDLNSLNL